MSNPQDFRHVVAIVPDLFFATRIAGVARAAGVELETLPPQGAFEHILRRLPALVLLDLHLDAALELVRSLKADAATRAIRVIGFFSHVEVERRTAALEAGIDVALPRSAFTVQLADLLAGREATPAKPARRVLRT